MPVSALARRLDRIETAQQEDSRRLVRIEEHVNAMNGDLAGVVAELGGAPDADVRGGRGTVRARLHDLEKSEWAKTMLQEAREANVAAHRAAWSRKEKVGLFGIAAIGCTSTLLRLFGVGG